MILSYIFRFKTHHYETFSDSEDSDYKKSLNKKLRIETKQKKDEYKPENLNKIDNACNYSQQNKIKSAVNIVEDSFLVRKCSRSLKSGSPRRKNYDYNKKLKKHAKIRYKDEYHKRE